jgi:hypothetical protein
MLFRVVPWLISEMMIDTRVSSTNNSFSAYSLPVTSLRP